MCPKAKMFAFICPVAFLRAEELLLTMLYPPEGITLFSFNNPPALSAGNRDMAIVILAFKITELFAMEERFTAIETPGPR